MEGKGEARARRAAPAYPVHEVDGLMPDRTRAAQSGRSPPGRSPARSQPSVMDRRLQYIALAARRSSALCRKGLCDILDGLCRSLFDILGRFVTRDMSGAEVGECC